MYLDDSINHDKIASMTLPQLKILCKELRSCILSNVMKNGGHLASNLGTVELTAALHYVFDISCLRADTADFPPSEAGTVSLALPEEASRKPMLLFQVTAARLSPLPAVLPQQ